MQRTMLGSSKTILLFSLSSSKTTHFYQHPFLKLPTKPTTLLPKSFTFKPFCTLTSTPSQTLTEPDKGKHLILLERLRLRHLKEPNKPKSQNPPKIGALEGEGGGDRVKKGKKESGAVIGSFEELGLGEEVMGAVREMGIEVPTEIQCIGIPAVLDGKSVVLGSHTGSGKTLAYLSPLVQVKLLRQDEAILGVLMKPRHPRVIVLYPIRELLEQFFRVAKSISHHAKFRATMVSGGGCLRPQDSLNSPIDMVVGTPERVLQHIEGGNMVYDEIKYLVLDEADTMFNRGFGPDIRKFLGPLKNRASKPEG